MRTAYLSIRIVACDTRHDYQGIEIAIVNADGEVALSAFARRDDVDPAALRSAGDDARSRLPEAMLEALSTGPTVSGVGPLLGATLGLFDRVVASDAGYFAIVPADTRAVVPFEVVTQRLMTHLGRPDEHQMLRSLVHMRTLACDLMPELGPPSRPLSSVEGAQMARIVSQWLDAEGAPLVWHNADWLSLVTIARLNAA